MNFAMNVDLDNAAFDDSGLLPLILRKLATDVERGTRGGTIIDTNGNACGTWELVGEREEVM